MRFSTTVSLTVMDVYNLLESGCFFEILCSNNHDDSYSVVSFKLMSCLGLTLFELPLDWFEYYKPFIDFIWDGSYVHRCVLSSNDFTSFRKAMGAIIDSFISNSGISENKKKEVSKNEEI